MSAEFSIIRRVTFAETDLAGVLHFSNYFRMMEEAEHAYFRSRGLCVVQSDGGRVISWPRVRVSCEYFAPARFEDELELRFRIVDLGKRSMTSEVEFLLAGRRTALGQTKAACCAMTDHTFSVIDVPEHIRRALQPAAGARP